MGRTFSAVLILVCVSSFSAKHILVHLPKTWKDAQTYCRSNHTDLSPISNKMEYEVFKRYYRTLTGSPEGWIGLYLDLTSPSEWTWSGGAHATSIAKYAPFHPKSGDFMYWNKQGLFGGSGIKNAFFCFNLMVDDEVKTWEEALERCREAHTDLTSLHSDTEQRLALSEIQHQHISGQVWIGLRYLGDRWLWVDGDPLVYQAWLQGGDQDYQCPLWRRCGALAKEGHWENRDCEEKLNFICY